MVLNKSLICTNLNRKNAFKIVHVKISFSISSDGAYVIKRKHLDFLLINSYAIMNGNSMWRLLHSCFCGIPHFWRNCCLTETLILIFLWITNPNFEFDFSEQSLAFTIFFRDNPLKLLWPPPPRNFSRNLHSIVCGIVQGIVRGIVHGFSFMEFLNC